MATQHARSVVVWVLVVGLLVSGALATKVELDKGTALTETKYFRK